MGFSAFYHPGLGKYPEASAKTFGDMNFARIMLLKILCVYAPIRLGYNVLFQDADLIWVRFLLLLGPNSLVGSKWQLLTPHSSPAGVCGASGSWLNGCSFAIRCRIFSRASSTTRIGAMMRRVLCASSPSMQTLVSKRKARAHHPVYISSARMVHTSILGSTCLSPPVIREPIVRNWELDVGN